MRKSKTETAGTKARIVSNASRLFMARGISSVGTREIMSASGIAQGGFYRHFESKEMLLDEAYKKVSTDLVKMFEKQTARMSAREALETIVTLYLNQSVEHGKGILCPLAMLGSELKHTSEKTRGLALLGYNRLIQLLETHLAVLRKPDPQALATAIFVGLLGAVTLAGIAPNKSQAKQILKSARYYALRDID